MRDSCVVTKIRRMPRTTVFEPSRPDEAPETRTLVKVQSICDGLVERLHISSERYLNKIEDWASSVGEEGLVATTARELLWLYTTVWRIVALVENATIAKFVRRSRSLMDDHMAIRSEDHLATERAQADRSLYHVGGFAIHPFSHCGAPIRRKISYTDCPPTECGTAVPTQIPSVILQRGDSRWDT